MWCSWSCPRHKDVATASRQATFPQRKSIFQFFLLLSERQCKHMIVLVIILQVGSSHLLTDGGYGFVSFNLEIVQIENMPNGNATI